MMFFITIILFLYLQYTPTIHSKSKMYFYFSWVKEKKHLKLRQIVNNL